MSRNLRLAIPYTAMFVSIVVGATFLKANDQKGLVSSIGLKLSLIRAGGFEMGSLISEEGHTRREEQHTVRLTQPFYLGTYEVTQAEYESVMESNPSAFSSSGAAAAAVTGVDTSRFPVDNVSWFDAIEFCNKLSVKDKLKAYYGLTGIEREQGSITSATVVVIGGDGYRLPTEAEWEYACRAGTTTAYNSGEIVMFLDRAGWYGGQKSPGNSGQRSHATGLKLTNDFGLFDMHGNVAEWCQDWYDRDAYNNSPIGDPLGPATGSARVLRGGSWNDESVECRSASRDSASPARRSSQIGFRVARSLPAARAAKPKGIPPYRVVIDLRDGDTVDFFRNESYDTIDSAKERLAGSKLFGRLNNVRIIDANGTTVD